MNVSWVPGNGGIVPPWLRDPWRIVLPVEPDDGASLPVLTVPPTCLGNSPVYPVSSIGRGV